MNVMDRYRKEVMQVSTRKHDINVQYLYDSDPILSWYSDFLAVLFHHYYTNERKKIETTVFSFLI